ncbi:hypothetical protein PLESTM_000837200 [Pleodorina starrii]|nr:hypothetical protein PLESTM_000837200 [Pleodorina starrii]
MQVCAAVAPEVLSNGRIRILPANGTRVLPVGRLDSIEPAPPGLLPNVSVGMADFARFWAAQGIKLREATALMGSHALIDEQGCFRGPKDVCDPTTEDCSDVRMFRWEDHYYKDLCSPTLNVHVSNPTVDPPEPIETPTLGMTEGEIRAEMNRMSCSFTSEAFRNMSHNRLRMEQAGLIAEQKDVHDGIYVEWSNKNCPAGVLFGVNASHCPHFPSWPYTGSDAYLGQACQGVGRSAPHSQMRAAAREFVVDQAAWDAAYRSAYIKMVSIFATFAPSVMAQPFNISGDECVSRYHLEAACAQEGAGPATEDTMALYDGQYNVMYVPFIARYPELLPGLLPEEPLPAANITSIPERPLDSAPFDDDVAPNVTANGVLRDPPVTPYHSIPRTVCPYRNGLSMRVNGYPSSPFMWTPFTRPFVKPPRAQVANSYCKPDTNLCLDAYEIDIYPTNVDLGCSDGTTWILSYNGSSPGPTIRVPVGRQTLVRFNNRMTAATIAGTPFSPFTPCDTTPGRQGRPIAVHLHGEASLAPYDGWAEDTTCGGESKDYYYSNHRQALSWYHDHQLELTSENTYFGLAGMYVMTDKTADGGCGEPWNLDGVPDTDMMFKDAVLDSSCQLYYDHSRSASAVSRMWAG